MGFHLQMLMSDALLDTGYYCAFFLITVLLYSLISKIPAVKKRMDYNPKRIITNSLLISYALFLFCITVGYFQFAGASAVEQNLIPFDFSGTVSRANLISQIPIYIPLGFLLALNFKKHKSLIYIITAIIIPVIKACECLRYNRAFNINEIIFNIIGAAIGIGLAYLLNLIFKNKSQNRTNR